MSKRKSKNRPTRRLFSSSQPETLESRVLLTGDTFSEWQNQANPLDINQDSYVSPADVLAIQRILNSVGSHELQARASAEPTSASAAQSLMLDASGDGFVSPLDALLVVRGVNAQGEGEGFRVRTEVVNSAGEVVTNVTVGDTFTLNVYAQDLRDVSIKGVFGAYADVTYDPSIVSVAQGATVQNIEPFTDGESGDVSQPGLIDEVGGFDQDGEGDGNEELFASVEFVADTPGSVTFQPNPADNLPANEFLPNDASPVDAANDILFEGVTLNVVAEQGSVQDLGSFAKALDAAGVEFWSTRQFNEDAVSQRELFEDAESFLPFNESFDSSGTLTAEATAAGITDVNTWIFPDDTRATGVLTIQELATRSGVAVPDSVGVQLKQVVENNQIDVEFNSPLHLGLDAYDPTNGPVTYTVTADDTSLIEPVILSGNRGWEVEIEGYGKMVFEFYEGRAPRATSQFITLTEQGFYDGLTLHRILEDFVIQGGDPTGTGSGSSDLPDFDDQFHVDLQHNRSGILSMAKSSDDTNNSQFFVTDGTSRHLDFNHTIFGQLIEGFEVLEAVSAVDATAQGSPAVPVVIKSARVINDTENAVVMLRGLAETGSTNVTVTATDSQGNISTDTFEVNLIESIESGRPFLDDIPDFFAEAGQDFNIQLSHTDIENDSVTYTATRASGDATVTVSDAGLITVSIPDTAAAGDQIRVNARVRQDGLSFNDPSADDQQILITVSDGFQATDDTLSIDEDSGPHTLDVLANDSGVGTLTITNISTPTSGGTAVLNTDGQIVYRPGANFPIDSLTDGTDTFVYTVIDADNNTTTATVTVTVAPVNDPPTANDDEFPADFSATDATETINLREDSTTQTPLFVIQNDAVLPDRELSLFITDATSTSGAAVEVIRNRTWVGYTPAPDTFGADTFTYTIEDPNSTTDTATVTVNIAQVNDAPVAGDDTINVVSGVSTIITADQLLGNDTAGPQEDAIQTLTIDNVTQPANGTVTLNSDGTLTYVADAGFEGPTTFEYTITDDGITEDFDATTNAFIANSDPLTTTGTVTVNSSVSQVANDDAYTVDFSFITKDANGNDIVNSRTTSLDVRANDDLTVTQTITAVSDPANGTATIINNGADIAYTGDPDFTGPDTFTYTLTADNGSTSTATVTVNVQQPNANPEAVDDSFDVQLGTGGATLNVLDNDTVDNGTKSVAQILDQPDNGTVEISADRTQLIYTPDAEFTGTDTLIYQISDGNGGVDAAQVTLLVTSPIVNPVANDDTITISGGVQRPLDVLANDTTDSGTLTISLIVTPPTNGVATVSSDGLTISYERIDDNIATDTFVYQVSNGEGGVDTATVSLTIEAQNSDPVANDDAFTLATQDNLDVLQNDTTEAGEVLEITNITIDPTRGVATISADNKSIDYVANTGELGTDTLTYEISDGNGGTSTAVVSIEITNAPPVATDDSADIGPTGQQTIDVLANDTVENGETKTIDQITVAPTKGTAEISTDGTILYTPDANVTGTDTLTYQLSDGRGGTDTAVVNITFTNLAPVVVNDTIVLLPGTSQTLDVLANDSGQDGETLTIAAIGGTPQGTVVISGDGTSLTYTPAADSEGTTDTFTYTVADGTGLTSEGTVNVDINSVSDSVFEGVVFQDRNNNGQQEANENGIGGVTVVLSGTDTTGNSVRQEVRSSIDGSYAFTSVLPGDYSVTQTQPQFMSSGTNMFGTTVTEDDNFSFQVDNQLIDSSDNTFAEQGIFAQFALLDALSSSRQQGVFVVMDGDELAWVEDRGGWDDVGELMINRTGDELSLVAGDNQGTLSMNDRSQVQVIGRSGDFTVLRINGSSANVLSAAAVDQAMAGQ